MDERKINKWVHRGRLLWLFTKFQLITKGLLALIIIPLFKLILHELVYSTGRTNLSSGDYLSFFLSYQGVAFLITAFILVILLIGIDINAFIIMTALIAEGKIKMNARTLILVGIRSVRLFLKPSGIFIVLYIAVVIPFVGISIGFSPIKGFKIPNFAVAAIYSHRIYGALYTLGIIGLLYLTLKYIFALHYIVLLELPIREGLKKSSELMKRHWISFIKDFILKFAVIFLFWIMLCFIVSIPLIFTSKLGNENQIRFYTIFSLLTLSEVIAYGSFMLVPILINIQTKLFYKYNILDKNPIRIKVKIKADSLGKDKYFKVKFQTKISVFTLIIFIVSMNLISAHSITENFDALFRDNKKTDIIAHRAGGDLASENTVEGLNKAIKQGAQWAEIDVQRTKDGKYIVYHDKSFKRLCGVSETPEQMTLREIKRLRVKDEFNPLRNSQPIPTLKEMLNAAKGKIGLLIELKGNTANRKMADDVVRIINEENMSDNTAVISLDYPLIKYIKEKHPKEKTGYIYFFSFGNPSDLDADFLIMEEEEATPRHIEEVQNAGKKAIVWTVDTPYSIEKFTNSDVDGIITNHIKDVRKGIELSKNRTKLDIIIDAMINRF